MPAGISCETIGAVRLLSNMRGLLVVAALLSVALLACGGDGDDSDTSVPILYAMTHIQNADTPNQVEPRGVVLPGAGKQDCLIPATATQHLEGTCEWEISSTSDGGWVARYFETWKCADYVALGGDSGLCPGETGTHEWDYQIAPDGTTELVVQTGDAPPESLGAGAPGQ